MSKLQRWFIDYSVEPSKAYDYGEWVRYEDAKALEDRVKELEEEIANCKAENESMKRIQELEAENEQLKSKISWESILLYKLNGWIS